ncbi:hypothetical protein SDC9_70871 [bioreactor metagenome]|uniref:NAD-specific glutamate dehydrogenase n=1 Tax=bioreactor metagenome TaxID=1076179 RepID=A0A644Y7V6_9ZZZZ
MGHLDELVLHSAGLLHAVVLSSQRGSTDHHVAHAHLAATVALAMIAGKAFHHHAGELILAIQEEVLVGNEHMVQNHQGLLTAELCVANIDGAALQLAGVAALAAVDHVHALGIRRAGKGNCPVLVSLTHGDGRHENVPVGVDGAGLVALGPADHNAVRAALHHMHIHIRVSLLMRRFGAVTLRIGHRAVHRQVVILHHFQELLEVLVIVRAVCLIDLIGRGEHRIEAVHAHAALETGSGLLAQQTLHLHLVDQILRGLMQMGKAVDGVAGQAGLHGHKVRVLGILRQCVGHGHAVDRRSDHRIIYPVFDLLAEHINSGIELAQRVDVLLRCH